MSLYKRRINNAMCTEGHLLTTYEARTLLGLDMSRCRTLCLKLTLIITLNYVIFSNY